MLKNSNVAAITFKLDLLLGGKKDFSMIFIPEIL